MKLVIEAVLLLVCLVTGWFFAGIETGLISINRLRLRHLVRRKVPGADILQGFLRNPDRLLGTTLVGTNVSYQVASVMAAGIGYRLYGPRGAAAAGVIMALVILTFCEYFSKAWFQSFPAHRSLPFAPLLNFARVVLSPLSRPLMYVVKHLVPVKTKDDGLQPFITREEIVHLASEGKASGILTPAEHRMIHEVIQLKTISCREIMTPREKMVWVEHTLPVPDLLEQARQKEVNRFPVYDSSTKTFVGIVHIFDILACTDCEGKQAKDFMRPPQMVADHTPVDHVLPRMRVTRQHMVLVVNDRYDVIGLITLEDVLQEVVGAL